VSLLFIQHNFVSLLHKAKSHKKHTFAVCGSCFYRLDALLAPKLRMSQYWR